MASVVRMPSVLAGATEAAIASWLVAPGDAVSAGDPLAEIETEKAIVEYSAEEAGVVGRLVLAAGEAGEIGAPIAVLVKDGETDADIDAALSGEAPAASPVTTAGIPAVSPLASAPDPAAPAAPDAAAPSAPSPSGVSAPAYSRSAGPAGLVPRPRTGRTRASRFQPPRGPASSPARSCASWLASRASISPASPGRARMAGSSAGTSNGSPPVISGRRATPAPGATPRRRRPRSGLPQPRPRPSPRRCRRPRPAR